MVSRRVVVGLVLIGVFALIGVISYPLLRPAAARALHAQENNGLRAAFGELVRLDLPWHPSVTYETLSPEGAGLDPAKLEAWKNELAERRTRQLLVIRNGKIAYEWFAPGRGPDNIDGVSANAKAFAGSMALGAMLDDGLVALDDPVWKYVPGWKDRPLRSQIRIRQLLNHTSGIQNISYGAPGVEHSGWERVFDDDKSQRFQLTLTKARALFTPGECVEYSSLAYYALTYALTAALRGTDYPDVRSLLERRIMEPLEIGGSAWYISERRYDEVDGMRLYSLASGAAYSPRALARISELILGSGEWKGRRILSRETVAELLSTRGLPDDRPAHEPLPALGWWTNAEGAFPSLPRDAILSLGAHHRLVWIVPSLDLIGVRFGESLHHDDGGHGTWDGVDEVLFAPLMDAIGTPGNGP